MAKILITGGAGYIGSVLVPMLLNEGHKIVVIDNFMYNQVSLLDCIYNERLTVIRGNACDEALIKYWVLRVDGVIPLAALVGVLACDKNPLLAGALNFG